MTHAAMGGGGGIAGHVEQRPASDGDEVGVPVDVMALNLGIDFADKGGGIFGALAPAGEDGRSNEPNLGCVGGEVPRDFSVQLWHGLGERIFEDHQRFAGAKVGEGLMQHRIVRRKHVFTKKNA